MCDTDRCPIRGGSCPYVGEPIAEDRWEQAEAECNCYSGEGRCVYCGMNVERSGLGDSKNCR